jgi:hypothetical protein
VKFFSFYFLLEMNRGTVTATKVEGREMTPLELLAKEMATSVVWCSCECHGGVDGVHGERCPKCGGEVESPKQVPDVRFASFICNHDSRWVDVGMHHRDFKKGCSVCLMDMPSEHPGYVVSLERIVKSAGMLGVAHIVMKSAADAALGDASDASMRTLFKSWSQARWKERPKTLYELYTGKRPDKEMLRLSKEDLFG